MLDGLSTASQKMDIDVLTSRRAVFETHLDGFASFAQVHGVQTGDHLRHQAPIRHRQTGTIDLIDHLPSRLHSRAAALKQQRQQTR